MENVITVAEVMSSPLNSIKNWLEEAARAGYKGGVLAANCLVSDDYLRHYFKAEFGKPIQRWLNELRLCHAARLLCSGLQVKEVARLLGFADGCHLNHRFKEYFGCQPRDFVLHYQRERQKQLKQLQNCFGECFPRELLPLPPWEIAELNLCRKVEPTAEKERLTPKNLRPRQF